MTMSLDSLAAELLEPFESWKYRLCHSCSEILCMTLQNKQSTFLNDLTDTTLALKADFAVKMLEFGEVDIRRQIYKVLAFKMLS